MLDPLGDQVALSACPFRPLDEISLLIYVKWVPREMRLAHNEALFREVNERIAEAADPAAGRPLHLICECASVGCEAILAVPLDDYRWIREQPRLFLIAPDHPAAEGESLVGQHAGFNLIERAYRKSDLIVCNKQ